MKIQGGSAGGRRLKTVPRHLPVRPILARIKKSLFDILRPRIGGSRFLDLYAGTGSVGLEALSNGANHVTFVELQPKCVRVIRSNLESLGWTNRAVVFRRDVTLGLGWLHARFDLVFMGPPYRSEDKKPLALTSLTLGLVGTAGILSADGMVIGQHHGREDLSAALLRWDILRQEKYGDSCLTFLRRKS